MNGEKGTITLTELDHITRSCLGVLSNINKITLEGNDSLTSSKEEIIDSLRKLLVATALCERRIICIAGLQGAGKTTLLSNFYGLNDVLQGTLGVGERVPIIITEKKDVSTPKLCSVAIYYNENKGIYECLEEDVDIEKYDETTHATHSENSNVMYFNLYVPYKYLKDSYGCPTSFMLLPGHEPNKGENYYWNTLIDFALNSSDSAVFVLNERRMADYGGTQYLKKNIDLFGNNIIYVLTHADESSDENAQLKESLINELNIQADRIVCSGFYPDDAQKDDAWKNSFMKAIDSYAKDAIDIRNRNTEYICKELSKLRKNLIGIRGGLKQAFYRTQDTSEEIIDTFDECAADFRVIIEKKLSHQYSNAAKESIEKLNIKNKPNPDKKDEPKERINKIIKDVKRFFGLNNVYEQFIEPEERVKELLTDSDNKFIPDKYLREAFHEILDMFNLPKVEGSEQRNNRKEFNSIAKLIKTQKGNDQTLLIDTPENVALSSDLKAVLSKWGPNDQIPQIKSNDINDLCAAIVQLGTYYLILCSCNSDKNNDSVDMSYDPGIMNPDVDHILEGANNFKKFAVGIAGMMGIDAISDGAINFLPQIAESIGVSLPTLSIISCAAFVVSGGITILRDINNMNCNDYKMTCDTIYRIYDELTINALGTYDEFMHEIRKTISSNLRRLDGNGKKAITIFNARAEITNAINIIDTVIERCSGQAIGMGVLLQ